MCAFLWCKGREFFCNMQVMGKDERCYIMLISLRVKTCSYHEGRVEVSPFGDYGRGIKNKEEVSHDISSF